MAFGKKLQFLLKILGFILAVVAIIFGTKEAAIDVSDKIGSNYWLAFRTIISGAKLIRVVMVLSKHRLGNWMV
jgi:hypothetical protein